MADAVADLPRVGPYVLERRIGAGGSGEVFEALNPTLGKKVAIKVLRAEGPGAAEALLAEARAANAVRHRNLVDVFDFGKLESGRAYLVMELLEGGTLAQVLAEPDRPQLAALLAWLGDVADALAALHAKGVTHGDLTPRNVFVVHSASGERYAKLLDFGLSRAVDGAHRAPLLAGTPRYLAPERLAGGGATTQADLYALGAVAYEALSGRPLFDAADAAAVAALQRSAPLAPLASVVPTLPLVLAGTVDALLGAEPAERPGVDAVSQALRGVTKALQAAPTATAGARPPAPPALPRPTSWWRRLLGGARGAVDAAPPRPAQPPAPAAAPKDGGRALALLSLSDLAARTRAPEPPLPPALRAQVRERALALVAQPGALPAFPWVAVRVVETVARGELGANELVRLLNQDATLTAQVVRAANSAASATASGAQVLSARDAVVRLGFVEVAKLASAAAAQQVYASGGGPADDVAAARVRAWQLGVTCAFAASTLAQDVGLDAQRAFVGGLLHDIGKDLCLRAVAALRADGALDAAAPLPLAALLDELHVELGVQLATAWQLPAELRDACALHHQPAQAAASRDVQVLRLVSALADLACTDDWRVERLGDVQDAAQALGLDRFRLRATVTQVAEFARRAQALTRSVRAG